MSDVDIEHRQRVRDHRKLLVNHLGSCVQLLKVAEWAVRKATRELSEMQANEDFAKAELTAFDARHAETLAADPTMDHTA